MRLTRSVKCEEMVSVNIGSSFQQVEGEEINKSGNSEGSTLLYVVLYNEEVNLC